MPLAPVPVSQGTVRARVVAVHALAVDGHEHVIEMPPAVGVEDASVSAFEYGPTQTQSAGPFRKKHRCRVQPAILQHRDS